MKLEELKKVAKKYILENEFEKYFECLEANLLDSSQIRDELYALKGRYYRFREDRIKGIISYEKESLAENILADNAQELLTTIKGEDLVKEVIPQSIESLVVHISIIRDEFRKISDAQGNNLILVGENLGQLGRLLAGEGPTSENQTSQYLISAYQKAKRRIESGFADLKNIKTEMFGIFQRMLTAYSSLVSFLDTYPSKLINVEERRHLEGAKRNLDEYANWLENHKNIEIEEFRKGISFFDLVLSDKDQSSEERKNLYSILEEIKSMVIDVLKFLVENDSRLKSLIPKMKSLSLELHINLQEAAL